MFKQKSLAKKTGFLFLIMAGLFLASINFVEAAEWAPITDLSSMGIAADDTVSLSDFIIVIYDFLLSAVGIAAMFMIVVGGFRYLTAAGNAAALSEAKDIIYSALYGLLLALCVWIIVSTINPDLVYLKQPGANPTHGDYSCAPAGTACNTDARWDGCKVGSLVDLDCPLVGASCDPDDGCIIGPCPEPDPDCAYKMCCSEYQTGTPMCSASADGLCQPAPKRCTSATISTEYLDPSDGILKCKCLDDEEIHLVPYADCDNACKSEGHCGWNFLVVRVNTDKIKRDDDLNLWEFLHDSEDENRNKMYDFFLTNDGRWGAFDITANSYNSGGVTYECAILVTARKTIAIGPITSTGDYRNIFWVKPGAKIGMKNDSSMQNEIGIGNYAQCCHQTGLLANPACKVSGWATPGCDCGTTLGCVNPPWCTGGNPGNHAPCNTYCAAELFDTKYDHLTMELSCTNCSAALSGNRFHPRYLTCDPATGMWR